MSNPTTQSGDDSRSIDIATLSQAIGLSSLVVYALGFVVVNAHLARWGVTSFDFANSQYLAAGLLYTVTAVIYALIVGRRLLSQENDYQQLFAAGAALGWRRSWAAFCWIFVWVELAFGAVVGIFWTSSLLFSDGFQNRAFTGVLMLVLVVDYVLLWGLDLYQRRPLLALPLAFSLHVFVLGFALLHLTSDAVLSLAILYVAVSFVVLFVDDVHTRSPRTKLFNVSWVIISVLSSAAMFGGTLYAEVKASLGGGELRKVKVILSSAAPVSVTDRLESRDVALLLAETSDAVLLLSEKESTEVFRLTKDLVAGMLVFPRDITPRTEEVPKGANE